MKTLREYIDLVTEDSFPKVVDASYVYTLAKRIHHTPGDLGAGDLSDRIFWFDEYQLINLPLKDINLSQWDSDEGRVADQEEQITKNKESMPPIIFDPIAHSIIDGTHRANAYHNLGYETIPAYVGSKKSARYGESEEGELDENFEDPVKKIEQLFKDR